jgi:hypothetical protein
MYMGDCGGGQWEGGGGKGMNTDRSRGWTFATYIHVKRA